MFLAPMLANPLPKKGLEINPGEWYAEEKFDGMRLIVEVGAGSDSLFTEEGVTSWSRYGLKHPLPTHILEAVSKFPSGIYDGELLVPGLRSYGSARLENRADLVFVMFDILRFKNVDTTPAPYHQRTDVLRVLEHLHGSPDGPVRRAHTNPVNSWDEVYKLRDEVWARDGEGLILKRISSPYTVGKRSRNFIKIKALRSATLTVVGFYPSRGEINDRGPFAMVELLDDEGNTTTVKTRTDADCRKFEEEARSTVGPHPSLGRRLCIEYQERTPDGGYRHPRWDRWENE